MSQLELAGQKLPSFLERLLDHDDAWEAHQGFGSADLRLKYKTEICRYWAAHGFCPFGESCAFAHGTSELRSKKHLLPRNFKTRTCVNFTEHGYCRYGDRCQFVHGEPAHNRQIRKTARRRSFEALLGSVTQDLGELAACGRLRLFRDMESDDSLSDQFSAVDWKWPGSKKRLYSV